MGRKHKQKLQKQKQQQQQKHQGIEHFKVYEYTDEKTKQKKRFKVRISRPEDIDKIADSIFGGRYYTLSEDPQYLARG